METSVVDSVVAIGDQIISTVSTASSNSEYLVNFVDLDWRDAVAFGMESLMVVQNNVVLFSTMFFGACIVSFVLTLIGVFFLQCGKYTNCTGTFLDDLDDQVKFFFPLFFSLFFLFFSFLFLFPKIFK